MKILPWILLIVGAIAVWLLWPQTGTSDREKALVSFNQDLQLKIDSLTNRNTAILVDVRKDSAKYLQERNSFNAKLQAKNREVSKWRVIAAESRAKVQEMIDTVPALSEFVAAQDSVISSLDSLNTIKDHQLAAAEHAYNKLSVNVQGLTKNFEQRISLHAQQYENAKEIIALKDKELKKSKRKTKLVGVLGIAAVGLLVGFQL